MNRISTGVSELDLVLGGGLEPGSLVVLTGAPGTGKTILAQQICFANATANRKAVSYTTLSEPHTKLVRHLEPFAFYDAGVLETSVEYIHVDELVRGHGADGLKAFVAEVTRKCFADQPVLVVVDSAKALRDYGDEAAMRVAFYELASRVAHTEAVLMFVGEYIESELEGTAEFAIADGIIHLAYEAREPLDRRWLRVVKMRGANHLQGKHSFRIRASGIQVTPRLEEIAPHHQAPPLGGRMASGIAGFDEMTRGGLPAGNATTVLGPSGCGKTVLALAFLNQGLREGERGLYVSFQEDPDQLIRKAASFGWDLEGPRDSGQLVIHHVPPGDLNLDAVGATVRASLERGDVKRVVLDSLGELVYAARESGRFPAYARALVGFVRAAEASLIVTSETAALGPTDATAAGLSFLFHNIVLLRYIEMGSEIRRAVTVLKMRDSDHAKEVREFQIDKNGLAVSGVLEGVSGATGWSALRAPSPPNH